MSSPDETMRQFIDSFSWRDGLQMMFDDGLTNSQIVEELRPWLLAGGTKFSSARDRVRRWRNGTRGRRTTGNPELEARLKQHAAATAMNSRKVIGWTAQVASSAGAAGSRSGRGPYGPMPLTAGFLASGNTEAAGRFFSEELMGQYGAPGLSVTDFEDLDVNF